MSRAAALLTALLIWAGAVAAQTGPHFYDIDAEVRIEGAVRSIRFESRYAGTAPFLVLELREKNTDRPIQVEISPAWFFDRDLHQGEIVRIVGSLVSQPGQPALLIAREVTVQGEIFTVRDRKGFPSWRGGPKGSSDRRRSGRV
ncbi:MAG: hypothetical protein PHI34_03780 [Acidobacteriota bacterium]|nr:hypothetical protein [Acidobacteriota bacterium]